LSEMKGCGFAIPWTMMEGVISAKVPVVSDSGDSTRTAFKASTEAWVKWLVATRLLREC
jgi:hypothetical protein